MIASQAASFISSGAEKSGKPCERLIAPYRFAWRVISRMTDSVNCSALWDMICLGIRVYGFWFLVCGLWFVVCGSWFLVRGFWFVLWPVISVSFEPETTNQKQTYLGSSFNLSMIDSTAEAYSPSGSSRK